MDKKILILISFLLLTSCFRNRSSFDKERLIGQLGIPIKLEYYKHIQGKAFQYSDTATFVITENLELKNSIDEIKNADNPETWKGAGWDKIKIYYADTIVSINTNSKKIGLSASGTFYDLGKENFITKRLNERLDGSR